MPNQLDHVWAGGTSPMSAARRSWLPTAASSSSPPSSREMTTLSSVVAENMTERTLQLAEKITGALMM